jgi:pilus assembly protein CpaB
MSVRIVLMGVMVMATLGLGIIGVEAMRPHHAPAAPPPPKVKVLAAARVVPGGALLKDDDLADVEVLESKLQPGVLEDTPEVRSNLHGALVLHYLDKGTMLRVDDVLRPRDRGFLAAVLSPGMRAIAVGVDAVSGAGGLIWPGDHIDLILTQHLEHSTDPGHAFLAQTVLKNARVIAVDQKLVQGANEAGATVGNLARTVTLEVTPDQAERVAVAERLGELSVIVRPASDTSRTISANVPAVYASDVSSALNAAPAPLRQTVTVIQGSQHQELSFP